MITITSKKLEKVMLDNFNKKVSYLGVLCDNDYKRVKPKKFGFIEWEKNKLKNITVIQEKHVLNLITNK